MTEEPEAPRLQDTTERSALPLPLPENEPERPPRPDRETRRRWRPLSGRGNDDADSPEPAPPEPARIEADSEPEPEPEANTDETDAAPTPDDGQPEVDPVFAPPAVEAAFGDGGEETRPEVLIGAAFVGGVALAFILKRLAP